MRKPILDVKYFKERRTRLADLSDKDSVFVFFSGKAPVRSNDTNYNFRPNSNFFYLTGFEEEEAVLIFRPGKTPETIMFVQEKNPLLETWEGFLYGEELTKSEFDVDAVHVNSKFSELAADYLKGASKIYYRIGLDKNHDEKIVSVLNTVLKAQGRKGNPLQSLNDPSNFMGKLRVIKQPEEIELMKKTCKLSALGHIEIMKAVKPGINERALQGVFTAEIMKGGAKTEAYNSIVGSGANATTLHYVFNDDECKDGELLLVDAGSEYKYYAGDITRTFPVNGKFSDVQKKLYQDVLNVQKSLIEIVKPGLTFEKLNETAIKKLTKIMIDHELLSGTVDENITSKAYKKYYPHGIGHYLGIDVHDVGYYEENGKAVPFKEGVCFTIEPGIYIPADDMTAPEKLRGIGIRIEDDILVTSNGHEVLTSDVTKEVDEIEKLMSRQ